MSTRQVRIAAATTGLLFLLGVASASNVLSQEAKMRACAVTPQTPVVTTFSITHAADIDKHFPHASHFFEFDGVSDGAFIVVFGGPITLPILGTAPLPGQTVATSSMYDKVVCILVGDTPAFYYNVNTTEMAP